MRQAEFDAHMQVRNLADRTRSTRIYALDRIENRYGIDLDDEFDHDGLESLLKQFSYSTEDERAGAPNPSKLDIEADKLRSYLGWYRSHLGSYRRFRLGAEDESPESSPEVLENIVEEAVGRTFALEKDLQDALRQNLAQLEEGLVIEDGGRERRVDAGFIDILAKDAHGAFTVIELKAGTAKPEAVAQILAYMGGIAAEIPDAKVRGILVAAGHDSRVEHAARAVPNLSLRKYRFSFEFD